MNNCKASQIHTSAAEAIYNSGPIMNQTHTSTGMRCRQVLRDTIILAVVGSLLTIEGCATRPAEPPKPPKPISLLAVLPVSAPISKSNTGFGSAGSPVVIPTGPGAVSAGAYGGALLGSLIVYGFQANKQNEREAIYDALSHVNFDAAAEIDSRLTPALEQAQVRLVRITDPAIAFDVRVGKLDGLPAGVDAILDVTVEESGYYHSMRAGGYSPMLQLKATLHSPESDDVDLDDDFGYYADWRDGGNNKRWVTTPKSMTFASIDLLKVNSADVHAGLGKVVDQLVTLMVLDVQHHTPVKPRVD
jgi:hypothetical protein